MGGNPKVSPRRRQRGHGLLWGEDVGGVCAEGAKGGDGGWGGVEEEDEVAEGRWEGWEGGREGEGIGGEIEMRISFNPIFISCCSERSIVSTKIYVALA